MNALLEVALFLVVGRVLAASGRIPHASSGLTSWVLYVAWPAAALQSAPSVRLDGPLWGGVASLWSLFAVAIVAVAIAIARFGLRRPTGGAVLLASGAGSTAGFALPFIEQYCGAHCVAQAIVLSVFGGALAFGVLGVAASCVLTQGRVCVGLIVRRLVTFPPLVAIVIGLVLPRSVLPQFFNMALHDLAATLAPVAIVAVGMHLRLPARRRAAAIAAALGFRLVLAPATVLLGVVLVAPEFGSFGKLLVLLAAMPPLVSSIALAREYGLESELTAEMAAFGASLALVTVPLWGIALEYVA
ncbi:MAG TPA: AEC family transporter [Burkholderiaceae bacterium]|nr:AEC family transporter [Burkholderiaceae bacterium]